MVVGETALMIRILRGHIIHAIIIKAALMDSIVKLSECGLPAILLELFFLYLLGGNIVSGTLNSVRFANSLILGRKRAESVISLPVASLDPLKSRHLPAQWLGAPKSFLAPVYWLFDLEAATPW
jgi:hypothetical protein